MKFNAKYQTDSKIGIWAKLKFRLQTKEEARKEVEKWAELQPMAMEYLGQKLDLIDTEKYPLELPTKALLLVLIIVTLIIVIGLVVALVKWWRGCEGSKEIKNMVKLLQIKDHMRYFFPHSTLTGNKANHQGREPVTPTAALDNRTPRRRSLGLPPDAQLVNLETQVQVHSLPRASQPAPRHNPVDDEESVAPSHHKLQKDGEPVQTLLRQIVRDTEAADRYAKYINRKSKEELEKPEPTDK